MSPQANIAISESQRELLEMVAKRRDQKFSEFIRESALTAAEIDPVACEAISRFANAMKIPPSLGISNIVIRYFAEKQAWEAVWGKGEDTLPEFTFTSRGPLTGKRLLDFLRKDFEERFTRERLAVLLEREKTVFPLRSEEERAFLMKHRQGRTWYESPEYQEIAEQAEEHVAAEDDLKTKIDRKLEEAKAEGLIDADFDATRIRPEYFEVFFEEYEAGRMSKDQLKQQLQNSQEDQGRFER